MMTKHMDLNLAIEMLRYYGGWAGKVDGRTIEVGSGSSWRLYPASLTHCPRVLQPNSRTLGLNPSV